MTNHIERKVRVAQGDAKIIPFVVLDEDTGDPVDVESADISWKLETTRVNETVLSLDDTDVSIADKDTDTGRVSIRLDTGATEDLKSTDYREVIQIVDASGDQTTWVGDRTFELLKG